MKPAIPNSDKEMHHAYFIFGERGDGINTAKMLYKEKLGVSGDSNPDVFIREYETFGIDDARGVTERQFKKSLTGRKIFVLALSFITREAQNALLKTFEEPTSDTYFFIVAPSPAMLLPTLRSRIFVMPAEDKGGKSYKEAVEFLGADVNSRLKMTERFKETENETKKSEILSLINQIEKTLFTYSQKDTAELSSKSEAIQETLKLKRYLFDRSPSVKMIAEHLALRLPRIKIGGNVIK